MNAAQYAAKKTAGLCAWNVTCSAPSTDGVLCADHRKMARVASKAANKRLYDYKKVHGICVWRGCKSNSREDSVLCQKHSDEISAHHRIYNQRPARKKLTTAAQRRFRRRRIKAGLCTRCDQPAVTKLLCEAHRRELLNKWRARKGPPTSKDPCKSCGRIGHRSQTCQERHQIGPIDVVEYALARQEAA